MSKTLVHGRLLDIARKRMALRFTNTLAMKMQKASALSLLRAIHPVAALLGWSIAETWKNSTASLKCWG